MLLKISRRIFTKNFYRSENIEQAGSSSVSIESWQLYQKKRASACKNEPKYGRKSAEELRLSHVVRTWIY